MCELRTLGVIGVRALLFRDLQHLVARNEDELCLVIDEALDQPWTGDAVDVRVLSRDPLHSRSLREHRIVPAGA